MVVCRVEAVDVIGPRQIDIPPDAAIAVGEVKVLHCGGEADAAAVIEVEGKGGVAG